VSEKAGKTHSHENELSQDRGKNALSRTTGDTTTSPRSLIGLYYPYWVFWQQDWLKLAALYWDKIARIVPQGMDPELLGDDETARILQNELGLIVNIPFSSDVSDIGKPFINLIQKHETALNAFRITGKSVKNRAFVPTYLWEGEMSPELIDLLLDLSFAVSAAPKAEGFLAMHPKLAVVYKQALAESMAASRLMSPVTDDVLFHVAASGCTPERIAQGLLDDVNLAQSSPSPDEVAQEMATVALRSVIPRDLQSVEPQQIVRLRKQHAAELFSFQQFIDAFVAETAALVEIKDPQARQAHLDSQYQKRFQPRLEELRKCMRSAGLKTAFGAMNVRFAIPPAIAEIAKHVTGAIHPIITATGAAIFSIVPVIRQKRRDLKEVVGTSPAAYLLYAQEELQPSTLASKVSRAARRFVFSV
jgi:hypothetical protein